MVLLMSRAFQRYIIYVYFQYYVQENLKCRYSRARALTHVHTWLTVTCVCSAGIEFIGTLTASILISSNAGIFRTLWSNLVK